MSKEVPDSTQLPPEETDSPSPATNQVDEPEDTDLSTATPSSLPLRLSPYQRGKIWFKNLSIPQKVLCLIALPLLFLSSYAVYAYNQQNRRSLDCTNTSNCPSATEQPSASSSPSASATTETLVPAALDGTLVKPGSENLHPLAVMIENHPDARPQAGLSQAALVYEAIAEGGITRFMAVFRDPSQEIKVGPIRSARSYFVDFATELNAFYAHVGGNDDALQQIRSTHVLDLDQFSIGAPVFNRDTSKAVALEHTMYSSTSALWNYATQKNHWTVNGSYPSWNFIDDLEKASRPSTQAVTVDVSDSLYKVIWNYDPASNSYSRVMAGAPHLDANTGKPITTKNIVLETVDRTPLVTRIQEHGWSYELTGSGKAFVIQNGRVIPATWKKQGTDRTRYYSSDGKEIAFVRGGVWVHIIHPDSSYSF